MAAAKISPNAAIPTTAAADSTAGTAGCTVPATSTPSPEPRAAGTPRRQAQVTASRPVMAAAITEVTPRPRESA